MKERKQYQVPMTMVHKILGSVVMINNTSNPDVVTSETEDPEGNDPNSRRVYWDDWDDEYDE